MGLLANTIKNAMLDAAFGAGSNANYFYRLFTAAPTLTNASNEVAGNAYAATQVTNNATNFPAAAGGIKSNGVNVDFPEATADYPADVTHIGLATSANGNTLIAIQQLDAPVTITSGKSFRVAVGAFKIKINDAA